MVPTQSVGLQWTSNVDRYSLRRRATVRGHLRSETDHSPEYLALNFLLIRAIRVIRGSLIWGRRYADIRNAISSVESHTDERLSG